VPAGNAADFLAARKDFSSKTPTCFTPNSAGDAGELFPVGAGGDADELELGRDVRR